MVMERIRRRIWRGIFPLLLLLPLFSSRAAGWNAYDFYQQYGTGSLVLVGQDLYFCTRAKLQTVPGYTYRTLGFTLSLRTAEGEKRQIQAALGESLKEISAVQRWEGGLPISYSLCCLSYETLAERLKLAYPGENLTAVFAGTGAVTLIADALMVIRLQGEAFGSIKENDRGRVDISGTIYQDPQSIAAAIPWAPGNDFTTHFNIRLTLTVPGLSPDLLVRHISGDTLFSLPRDSVWRQEPAAARLADSLAKGEEGARYTLKLSGEEVKQLKEETARRGYASRELNLGLREMLRKAGLP